MPCVDFSSKFCKTPMGSMRLVYLPTFTFEISHVGKYNNPVDPFGNENKTDTPPKHIVFPAVLLVGSSG